MGKHIASNIFTVLIVVLLSIGAVIAWGVRQYDEPGRLGDAVCLQIDRGDTFGSVSQTLVNEGAVSNRVLLRLLASYAGKEHDIKAGSFVIPAGASMRQIVEMITTSGPASCGVEIVYRIGVARTTVQVREVDPINGRFVEKIRFGATTDAQRPPEYTAAKEDEHTRFRVTMAEGVTSHQIVNALGQIDILAGTIDSVPAEGLLAPDTYHVHPGDLRSDLVARMQAAQSERLSRVWEARSEDTVVQTPQEALILASIIEKETGAPQERGLVAGVFANRLRRGMKLQSDPTVIYGVTGGEKPLGRGLRRSELNKETPWNTYVITGLPATPIANPGLASLEAAVAPELTEMLFFVANGTGGHSFAKTLAEHNKNVRIWREFEAKRRAE